MKQPRRKDPVPLGLDTAPMEARLVAELPSGPDWQFEPKWDGFRCLAFRNGDDVELRAKSGKSLTRYFPEVVASLKSLPLHRFVLDGELVIPAGTTLSFDELQMRLHPAASRIRRLSIETPALLIVFDCLMDERGKSLTMAPLLKRRAALESLFNRLEQPGVLRLSPYTRDRKQAERWLKRSGEALDGVVAKSLEGRYESGERAMQKVKQRRTADCVVGGFRFASEMPVVGSLLLGLYDEEGKLNHVGFTSSIATAERVALTKRLRKLIAEPGFTGNAPGGPSRWSTERSAEWQPLKPILVVEVRYDQVTTGRFRHGTKLLRWRPDKSPSQCTCEQLQSPAEPSALMRELRGVS
jgi:ATP-dependent DNA ligase